MRRVPSSVTSRRARSASSMRGETWVLQLHRDPLTPTLLRLGARGLLP